MVDNELKEVYTLKEFLKLHKITKPVYYKLKKLKKAPRIIQVERKIIITRESIIAWRSMMEDSSNINKD